MSGPGHNIATEEVRNAVRRVEQLDAEIAERNAEKSDIYKALKGKGIHTGAVKALVQERRAKDKNREAWDEKQMHLDLYRHAVGEG